MSDPATAVREGEYAARGDYHRAPDPHWSFYPTYLTKLAIVRRHLDRLPPGTRVVDVGCGEGVLVEEYAGRLSIEGVDANYSSPLVRRALITSLPYPDGEVPHALCLDVLEHVDHQTQRTALRELARILPIGGQLLVSVPNLANLQSRLHFLVRGRLVRTASEHKHPGDRSASEYMQLFEQAGFELCSRSGIFPTVPLLTALIRRRPARWRWLHDALTRMIPLPGLCFLNIFLLRKTRTVAPVSEPQ